MFNAKRLPVAASISACLVPAGLYASGGYPGYGYARTEDGHIDENWNIGPADDSTKITTNAQPVIPFDINEDWNLITRTIVPVIYQDDVFAGEGSQFELGDTNLSLFFSPKQPLAGGGAVMIHEIRMEPKP